MRGKRGQVRGLDFTISAFLFLIMLSQLILVVLNSQVVMEGLYEYRIEREEVNQLADRILGFPGTTGWGLSSTLPVAFGLADETTFSCGRILDSGKIARITTDMTIPTIRSLSGDYTLVNYSYVKSMLSLTDYNFELRLRSLLNTTLSLSIPSPFNGDLTASVQITNWRSEPVQEAKARFVICDPRNSQLYQAGSASSNYQGIITKDITIPDPILLQSGDPEFIIVAGISLGSMWSVTSASTSETIQVRSVDISSVLLPSSSSQIRLTYQVQGLIQGNHSLGILNFGSTASQEPEEIIHRTTPSNINNSLTVETGARDTGFIVGMITTGRDSTAFDHKFEYRLLTLPGFLDDDGSDPGIYDTFKEDIRVSRTPIGDVALASYAVGSRGILFDAQIRMWRSET